MIISLLLDLITGLLELLLTPISLPPMPEAIVEPMTLLVEYVASGLSFVWLVVPFELVAVVLPIVVVLENFDIIYSVVMWILKKIPFLGIK